MENLLQRNYEKYNYWNIELTELPTRGIFYNKNAIIKARAMSVLEIKLLATLQPANVTYICNEILEKCVLLNGIEYKELLLPDRNYLIFWIRLNSFTNQTGFNINIPACKNCHERIEYNLSLVDIKFNYLDNGYCNKIYLPDIDRDVFTKIPGYECSDIDTTDEITNIIINLDMEGSYKEKYDLISNLSALDYAILAGHIEKYRCGINTKINIECPHCHTVNPILVEINDKNLFAKVNLAEILEMIARICKYSNLQIPNDWSWIEVEVTEKVINNMIQEENAYAQAEIAKANAKTHTSSSPHI